MARVRARGTGRETSLRSDFIDWVPGVGRTAPEITHRSATTPHRGTGPQQDDSAASNTSHRPATSLWPAAATSGRQARTRLTAHSMNTGRRSTGGLSGPIRSSPRRCPGPVIQAPPRLGGLSRDARRARHRCRATPARTPDAGSTSLTPCAAGLLCANGHANSPERSACGTCGTPLTGTPRTVSRPPLGVMAVYRRRRSSSIAPRSSAVGRAPPGSARTTSRS